MCDGVSNGAEPLLPSGTDKGKKKAERPPIYKTRDKATPVTHQVQEQISSGGESSDDSLSETETKDHDFQNTEMRIGKSKLALTGLQWSIFNKAKSICEESLIFENPFPTTSEDVIVTFDA